MQNLRILVTKLSCKKKKLIREIKNIVTKDENNRPPYCNISNFMLINTLAKNNINTKIPIVANKPNIITSLEINV